MDMHKNIFEASYCFMLEISLLITLLSGSDVVVKKCQNLDGFVFG
jgi:hypothetical protein